MVVAEFTGLRPSLKWNEASDRLLVRSRTVVQNVLETKASWQRLAGLAGLARRHEYHFFFGMNITFSSTITN